MHWRPLSSERRVGIRPLLLTSERFSFAPLLHYLLCDVTVRLVDFDVCLFLEWRLFSAGKLHIADTVGVLVTEVDGELVR